MNQTQCLDGLNTFLLVFPLTSVTFYTGYVVGPLIGGLLSHPVEKYPGIFGDSSLFQSKVTSPRTRVYISGVYNDRCSRSCFRVLRRLQSQPAPSRPQFYF